MAAASGFPGMLASMLDKVHMGSHLRSRHFTDGFPIAGELGGEGVRQ